MDTGGVQVDAVVFDFFGTLTPGRSATAQTAARHAQAEALGVDPEKYDRTLSQTYRDRFRGITGDVVGSLAWLANQLGVQPSQATLERAARVRLESERVFADVRPGVVALLERLRADGLGIGLVSDCTAELPAVFPDLPIAPLVDVAVFSCLTGQVKPDPPNYLSCCEQLHTVPARCVYVGDGGSDELAGAVRVGMHAVHLDVAAERASVAYGRHYFWDGNVIGNLDQLPELLQELIASTPLDETPRE